MRSWEYFSTVAIISSALCLSELCGVRVSSNPKPRPNINIGFPSRESMEGIPNTPLDSSSSTNTKSS